MTDNQSKQAANLVERLFDDLLGTITTFSVYLGDRLGLYRALASGGSMTAGELAASAGIAERYAREWLEHQAVDGILEVAAASDDPAGRRYALPAGHAEVLTEADSLSYFAPFARLVTAAGIQLPALLDAYRDGHGVPWHAYGDDMRESQGDANRPMFLNQLAQDYLPLLPDVHELLQSKPGVRIADIGCGMGWSAIALAKAYPSVIVDGYDLDTPSIEAARRHAVEAGVGDRVRFQAQDAAGANAEYDLVLAFECIHDMPRPVDVLRTMHKLAGDAGTVIVMDERVAETFSAPADEIERLMYGYSILICLPGLDVE